MQFTLPWGRGPCCPPWRRGRGRWWCAWSSWDDTSWCILPPILFWPTLVSRVTWPAASLSLPRTQLCCRENKWFISIFPGKRAFLISITLSLKIPVTRLMGLSDIHLLHGWTWTLIKWNIMLNTITDKWYQYGGLMDATDLSTSPPNTHCWFLRRLRPVPKGDTFHWVTWNEALTMAWLFSFVACCNELIWDQSFTSWRYSPGISRWPRKRRWRRRRPWPSLPRTSAWRRGARSTSRPRLSQCTGLQGENGDREIFWCLMGWWCTYFYYSVCKDVWANNADRHETLGHTGRVRNQ